MEEVQEILAEEDPISYIQQFSHAFEAYGWYILLLAAFLAVIYKKAEPFIEAYRRRTADAEYSAKYHKDPDAAAARIAAQERYAMNLQEKYNRDAEQYKMKMEEKEARKRDEWIARQTEKGYKKGDKLGEAVAGSSKAGSSKAFKTDYNPLMGDSSSRGYRPTKKKACGGGGCG